MRSMRCTGVLVVGAVLLAAAVFAEEKPNLSGDWKINAALSDFGEAPKPEKFEREIDHQEPSLIVRTTLFAGTAQNSKGTYWTDGRECVNKSPFGETLRSTLRWDGKSLLIETKAKIGNQIITVHQRMELSDDGRTLTDTSEWSNSQTTFTRKLVFGKK